jgi:sugar lactone lactonase YvrE
MASFSAAPTGNFALELGEGPVWNPTSRTLSMVDIFEKTVHLFSLDGTRLVHRDAFSTEGHVGAALPLRDGSFVLCENHGIFLRHPDGRRELICNIPVTGAEYRCNDAKIGPDGHLWVGVMDYDATEGQGSLWRINRAGEQQQLLSQLTIPNGMDWSGDEFWFVNGPSEEIRCYRWDSRKLEDSGRSFKTNGTPDGLAIDFRGELWLALWGEGRVDHFDESGEVIDSVAVASPHSTSLCFAGENLDILVVTSARFAMSPQSLEAYDRAGDLFSVQLQVSGRQPQLQLH